MGGRMLRLALGRARYPGAMWCALQTRCTQDLVGAIAHPKMSEVCGRVSNDGRESAASDHGWEWN